MRIPKSLSRLVPSAAASLRADNWQQSLPLLVSGLLAVVLAWQLVQLVWTLLGARPGSAVVGAVDGPPIPRVDTAKAVNVRAIVDAHLFGVASAPGDADPSSAPATQMSLVLVGTLAQADPAHGMAIIGESSANAKVYTVGKTVSGGTKLHSVYADRVILDRGGKLEALLLPKQFRGGGPAPRGQNVAAAPQPLLGDRIRQIAQQNPGAITEIMRPQPVFKDGQQRGYRVYPGRNRQQFAKLGLMPGDLVTAINGAALDDPARGMEILQAMNSATDVTVTIERNGQTSQISIDNAQVAAEAAAAAAQSDAVPVPDESAGEDTLEATE